MPNMTFSIIITMLIALRVLASGRSTNPNINFTNAQNLDDAKEEECRTRRLFVISFDGFRWNYLNRTATPNYDKFIHNGVQAQYGLNNAFITKTFPNHYTLVTGLWEESHNIVANTMYDPLLNQTFSPRNVSASTDPAWFDMGGEPIWVTNQLRGNGRSGVAMWVGSEAPVHNVLPTKHLAYDRSVKNESKIETIIKWFKSDCQMNLGMAYFRQPDHYGHMFGPESEQVTRMIGGLDTLVGYLLRRFEEEGLLEHTNIILTSDHGFASTPESKRIDLDMFIRPETRYISDLSPIAAIWPHEGFFEEIYKNLTSAATVNGHFTVYKKEDIPEHYHYKFSRRIPPILVVAMEFYSFTAVEFPSYGAKGNHGYDNELRDMHPFFLAMGPDFKSGFAVNSFDNVDLYPLMCHLLGVPPSPNNGSMDIVSDLLIVSSVVSPVNPESKSISADAKYLLPIATIASLLVISLAVVALYTRRRCKEEKNTSTFDSKLEDGDIVPLLDS